MHGIVKWFDTKKGFGFICGDDGKDYFVHYSGIAEVPGEKRRNLHEDQKVTFDVVEGKKGPNAQNVKVVD